MSDRLSGAIDELEIQLEEQQTEVANTKKLINSLLKRMGQPVRYEDVSHGTGGTLRADEYYGKSVTAAAQMFIERRHTALTVDDVTKGIEQGGFDFKPLNWSENARVRNVAISLSKNPKIFHKLPNGTWGLTAWYPNVKIAEKRRDKPEEEVITIEGDGTVTVASGGNTVPTG